MEKNLKKFIAAAFAPIIILVGVLIYISPFSSDVDAGTNTQDRWVNNINEAPMHGNGGGASSFHGSSTAPTRNDPGTSYGSSHENWNKGTNEEAMHGKGRGRWSSDQGDDTASHGNRGNTYSSPGGNHDGNSSNEFTRGKGRGRGSSRNSGDITTQRGRGRGNFSDHNNGNNVQPHDNHKFPSQQRENENKAETPSTPLNYTELIYT